MKKLLALILFLVLGVPYGMRVNNRAAMRYIDVTGGHCTAYVTGSHEVVTAAHCYIGDPTIGLNGTQYRVLGYRTDGHDHIKLALDGRRFLWRILPFARPLQTQAVYSYGNPPKTPTAYREGYVIGRAHDFVVGEFPEFEKVPIVDLFSLICGPGDSGAVIFSYWGYPVGIVSYSAGILTAGEPVGRFK